jgi:hypothetical protein
MDVKMFAMIMAFYAVLSCLLGPAVGWAVGKNATSAGNGFVAGSLISIGLWYTFGKKMVK